ncbi:hypothetical protein OS493_033991 [Desmophyllum pertusum]|uniref:WASH complex subunit 7 C-terminal domain-containing protein n=1 Tax=Desmophyllum pertusum TaxID=174260 RepID=A0A9W9Z7Z5_9CNID|nr:hypothetical protein OS493_033991 [Desmophyllum pertusum]
MGYIRMIRSGGLHCCSNAIKVQNLDAAINDLAKNFAGATEYFKLLVDVFAPEFRESKNMHLRNFYAIIPPLTLNFVEYMLSCKEKLNKKNKVGAAFTDDGLCNGSGVYFKVALISTMSLTLFTGFSLYRTSMPRKRLKWKASLNRGTARDEKLQQTMNLTFKRLNTYQQEFELVYFSLNSARIFFRGRQNRQRRERGKRKQGNLHRRCPLK